MASIIEGLLLTVSSFVMICVCPFTKVEESFNLQAIHDLIYHGRDIDKYDHLEFPGVVPRTFIGPLLVSSVSSPLVWFSSLLGANKLASQYIVRMILSVFLIGSFLSYVSAVRIKYGHLVSLYLCLVTVSQFHLIFYSSRPLPNVFALILVLLSLRCWLLQQYTLFIWLAGTSILIFRFELSILYGLILILELVSGRLKISSVLFQVIPATILLIGLSVLVDSYFWQRWVWPEGEVLWYNVILNKSSNWGTSPIWWYFTSALPRSLSLSLFLIPYGCYSDTRRTLILLIPALGFVSLYSLLPHKELRFIIYTIPMFNTVSAVGYAKIWRNRKKRSSLNILLSLFSLSSLVLSWIISLLFLYISYHNYPGGYALNTLHYKVPSNESVKVHINVEAAMTGVSRFGEINSHWNYSKTEDLSVHSLIQSYDYLLVTSSDYTTHYKDTHDILHTEKGFLQLKISTRSWPPLHVLLEDKITVLKKRKEQI